MSYIILFVVMDWHPLLKAKLAELVSPETVSVPQGHLQTG